MEYRLYIPKTLLYNWFELESFCEEQAPIHFLTVKKGLIYVLLKKSKGPSQAETTLTSNIIPLLIKNLEMFESEIKENSSQSTNSPPKEIHPILPAQRRILKILTLKKKKKFWHRSGTNSRWWEWKIIKSEKNPKQLIIKWQEDDIMALGFRVSFIWEDKDHFQLCGWVRLPLEWPKFPTYLQVSSVRKILDLFLFPTADVFLKCLWGQFLISSLRVFSYSDIPGLPGASELRTPQSKLPVLLPAMQTTPNPQALGPFPLGPVQRRVRASSWRPWTT